MGITRRVRSGSTYSKFRTGNTSSVTIDTDSIKSQRDKLLESNKTREDFLSKVKQFQNSKTLTTAERTSLINSSNIYNRAHNDYVSELKKSGDSAAIKKEEDQLKEDITLVENSNLPPDVQQQVTNNMSKSGLGVGWIILIVISVILVLGVIIFFIYRYYQKKKATKRASDNIDNVTSTYNKLNATYNKLKSSVEQINSNIEQKQQVIDQLNSNIQQEQQVIDQLNSNIQQEQQKIVQLNNNIEQHKQLIATNSQEILTHNNNLQNVCNIYVKPLEEPMAIPDNIINNTNPKLTNKKNIIIGLYESLTQTYEQLKKYCRPPKPTVPPPTFSQ